MTFGGEEELPPGRWFVITHGRAGGGEELDFTDLIETVGVPCGPEEQGEGAAILRLCQTPQAVVEISSHLKLPVRVVRILLADLLTAGRITVHRTHRGPSTAAIYQPPLELLERVQRGLLNLDRKSA